MEKPARLNKIESYGQAGEELDRALDRFPMEMWGFKPGPDDWSIHEIIIHITDSEANSYVRCRRFIAEPGKTLMAYDESGWAQRLNYMSQDFQGAIALFKLLRQSSYQLIRNLPESVWSNAASHPESGDMNLEDWLEIYERHVREHVGQMETVYHAWQEREQTGMKDETI
jgi:hypothetical protein